MTILLTGGTGKTPIRIARLLQDAKIPFLLASRRGEAAAPSGMPAVKFDWTDSSTFGNPFQHPLGKDISTVYLLAPETADRATPVISFVDYAIKEHGVKRFVLLGGSSTRPGGNDVGKAWQHFIDIGVEHCVLQPTWFMENFSEPGQGHIFTIQGEGKIYTACEDGKIPFVSANDIAAVAFKMLTIEKIPTNGCIILGPELLTYDQIAAKLSSSLGREIVHVKLTLEQRIQSFISHGLPDHFAKFIASIEVSAANGSEEIMNDLVEQVTGRPPQNFDAFVQEHKAVWK